MASITSIGVGSGIDLEGLVEKLISAERDPQTQRLDLKESVTQGSISALGNLKGTLAAFQDSLANLKDSEYFSGRSAVSGDSTLFTASASSTANIGTHTIEVDLLASANKIATNAGFTNPNDTLGEGTITISFLAGSSFDIDVLATDDLSTIRDAINDASDNIGVTASLITGVGGTELVLTANDTGTSNQLDIQVDDTGDGLNQDNAGLSRLFYDGSDPDNTINGLNQAQQIDAAQDARIYVDGFEAVSSTNDFSDVLEGVTITALSDNGGEQTLPSASLTLSTDKTSIKSEVETFVASYNELVIVLNSLTDYDPVTESRGILSGDSTVSTLEAQIRRVLTSTVDGADSDLDNLALLGITTNSNGTIALDEEVLDTAITNNFDSIGSLFGGDNGIASRLDDLLEGFLKFDGLFANKEDTFNAQLAEIEDQRAALEFRLEKIEARFRSQFSSLDILVSQLNQTGDFLTQQLDAAARIVNRDNS
jgi:flagellar hook-associated protein 2